MLTNLESSQERFRTAATHLNPAPGSPQYTEPTPISAEDRCLIVTGIRTGAISDFLPMQARYLLDRGVNARSVLHLDLGDERLRDQLKDKNQFEHLIDEWIKLGTSYLKQHPAPRLHLFISEIQRLERPEELLSQIKTRLGAIPFDLVATSTRLTAATRTIADRSPKKYSVALPAVAKMEFSTQRCEQLARKHQFAFNNILTQDILSLSPTLTFELVTQVAYTLLGLVGHHYSINKITYFLKLYKIKGSKESVSHTINELICAQLFFSVLKYNEVVSRQKVNPRKIYVADPNMLASLLPTSALHKLGFLENIVFLALKRRATTIYYYNTRAGYEVSFLALFDDGSKQLIHVCQSLGREASTDPAVKNLAQAMKELQLSSALLLTEGGTRKISTKSGMIEVQPISTFTQDNN